MTIPSVTAWSRSPEEHTDPRSPHVRVDPDVLSDLSDPRPSPEESLAEEEWMARHWSVAWRSAERDFDKRSLAMFADLLEGDTVAQVARRHSTSTEAVYKVKQRMTRRLRELVARSIENERKAR